MLPLSWCRDSIRVTSNAWWDRSYGTPPIPPAMHIPHACPLPPPPPPCMPPLPHAALPHAPWPCTPPATHAPPCHGQQAGGIHATGMHSCLSSCPVSGWSSYIILPYVFLAEGIRLELDCVVPFYLWVGKVKTRDWEQYFSHSDYNVLWYLVE